MAFEIGTIVEGKVVKTTRFGAFVQLDEGATGLIHISEISNSYVREVADWLRENDTVRAKVVAIKPDGKIDLSLKDLEERPEKRERLRFNRRDPSFEKMMKQFLRRSEEKQGDIKRSREAKRT